VTRDRLKLLLHAEVERWSARPYPALREANFPVVTQRGSPGAADFYQAEVNAVEITPEYVHVAVAVDDGGLSAFAPVSTSFVVYADGRIDVPRLGGD
jgi:hypothetical protein